MMPLFHAVALFPQPTSLSITSSGFYLPHQKVPKFKQLVEFVFFFRFAMSMVYTNEGEM